MSEFGDRCGDILDRLGPPQQDLRFVARRHAFDEEARPDERHRTDVRPYVEEVSDAAAHEIVVEVRLSPPVGPDYRSIRRGRKDARRPTWSGRA